MIKFAPPMAEVESSLLQRQQQILERRAASHARRSQDAALGATLFAIVAFSLGRYGFRAVCLGFAALWVSPAVSGAGKRPKAESAASPAGRLRATPQANRFPSPEALFARAWEKDRQLLRLPTPRPVHIIPPKRNMAAILFAAGFCALCLWAVLHQAERDGHLRPSAANRAMIVFGVGLTAAILIPLFHSLRKERHLLAQGQTALGLVIIRTEQKAGRRGWTKLW